MTETKKAEVSVAEPEGGGAPAGGRPSVSRPVLMRVDSVSKRFSRQVRASFRHTVEDIFSQLLGGRSRARPLRTDEFWALRDVDFEVRQGEALAVIGDNGAGKSTLVKLLMGRMLPTTGRIETHGSISALTVLGLGFDPVLSGRENIFLNAATLGLAHHQTSAILDQIIEFAEIGDFIDAPVQSYSSGMRARLGYAVAAHVNPDILLLDEVLAVGDIHFRRKCRRHIQSYIQAGGTVVLVTHDLQAVQTMCTRCLVLSRGRLLFDGDPVEGIHFYTELGDTVEDEDFSLDGAAREGTPRAGEASDSSAVEPESDPVVDSSSAVEESLEQEEVAADAEGRPPESPDVGAEVETELETNATLESTAREMFEKRNASGPSVSQPIVLDSMSIRPLQGTQIRTGEGVELELKYHSVEDVPQVVFGFTFCTKDGQSPIGSVLGGFSGRKYSVRRGRGEFRCRIFRLPLHAGEYQLKGGIAEAESGAALVNVGWEDAPLLFRVRSEKSVESNIHAILGDIVMLEGEFEGDTEDSEGGENGR